MNWTQKDVDEAIRGVGLKAQTDKDFRRLVLADPNTAIKQVTGKTPPPGIRIQVIENAPGVDQTYVLPDFRGTELTEDQLEHVAGGVCAIKKCAAEACAADSG